MNRIEDNPTISPTEPIIPEMEALTINNSEEVLDLVPEQQNTQEYADKMALSRNKLPDMETVPLTLVSGPQEGKIPVTFSYHFSFS